MNPDFSLAGMNTMRLQSTAEAFARFRSMAELVELVELAENKAWPLVVLGGGSNVLLSPRLEGLVIQSSNDSVTPLGLRNGRQLVKVGAGKNWHEWVCESIAYGHGLENLSLIPGSVGASPIQNIGAYGVEVGEYIESVIGYQVSTGQIRHLDRPDCRFGYRDSVFKRELKNDFVVTSVIFALKTEFIPELSYGPLASLKTDYPDTAGNCITPDKLIAKVCEIRSSKLPDPGKIPNCGSFFKNPVVSRVLYKSISGQFPAVPNYPVASAGSVKLAAAWLIDQSGWKGKRLGKVGMHDQQALVMTADDGATLDDVLALRDAVRRSVFERFGVELEPEPVFVDGSAG